MAFQQINSKTQLVLIWILLWISTVDLLYIASRPDEDGCNATVYRVLDDTRRSPSHHSQPGQELLCDDGLPSGWYRLLTGGRSSVLAGSCPGSGGCGSDHPVWLDHEIPSSGVNWAGEACVSWSFGQSHDCCLFTVPVIVRGCGDFVSYYLEPTQACNMAYCVQTTGNQGDSSITEPPSHNQQLEPRRRHTEPRLHVTLINRIAYFNCSFPSRDQTQGIKVTWYKTDRSTNQRIRLQSDKNINTKFHLFKFDSRIKMGEEVSCEVSGEPGSAQSASILTGISSPSRISLVEDGTVSSLTFRSLFPFSCPPALPQSQCFLRLRLNVRNDFVGVRPPDVVLSSCSVVLEPAQHCDSSGCGSVTVNLTAVQDFIEDGTTNNVLDVTVVTAGDPNWVEAEVEPIHVEVEDMSTSRCHVFTDPHFITFDQRRFDLYKTGTFLLFKSLDGTHETHVRLWDCSSRSQALSRVSCVCGFVTREGNDLISADMCNGSFGETLPELSVTNLAGKPIGAKVLESRQGKILTISFASGRFVRVHLEYWGMSMTAQASGADHGFTRGLCGLFDGDPNNDFHDTAGRIMQEEMAYGQINKFAEQWRFNPGESMFDKTPQPVHEDQPNFCSCIQEADIVMSSLVEDLDPSIYHMTGWEQEVPICLDQEQVQVRSLLHHVDITPHVMDGLDNGLHEEPDAIGFISDQPYGEGMKAEMRKKAPIVPSTVGMGVHWTLKPQPRYKRSTKASIPSFHALSPEDVGYIFPGDLDHYQYQEPIILKYPTKGGLTEDDIYYLCANILINSTIAKECGKFYTKDIMNALDICVLDVSLMDDAGWASYSLPLVESQCEESVIHSQLDWNIDQLGNLEVPANIVEAINCPNMCSGNGVCNGKSCVCQPGYSFYDCSHFDASLLSGVPTPYLYIAANNSLCDIGKTDCTRFQVHGQEMLDSPQLSCRIRPLKPDSNSSWSYVGGILDSRLQFVDENNVQCSFRESVLRHKTTFSDSDLILQIEVTNDGSTYSNGVFLTIYDGSCRSCSPRPVPLLPTICQPRPDTCRMDNLCVSPGTTNPRNVCQVCKIMRHGQADWERSQKEAIPAFKQTEISLKILDGDRLTYAVPIQGEGDVDLVLEESPPGAVLREGRLEWLAASNSLEDVSVEDFLISGRNECGDKAEMRMKLEVVRCHCHNGGWCVREDEDFVCECQQGFSGESCEDIEDPCNPSPCFYGDCVSNSDRVSDGEAFVCNCDAGFSGVYCETQENYCDSSPCFQGVECTPTTGSFTCGSCPDGLTGDGTTCSKPSLCQPNPCHPGVSCTAQDWYFTCGACPPGTAGDGVTCAPAGPCSPGSCHPGVSCFPVGSHSVCGACPAGFEGDGKQCSPVNKKSIKKDSDEDTPLNVGTKGVSFSCEINCDRVEVCQKNITEDKCEECREELCKDACENHPCYLGVTCHPAPQSQLGYSCSSCPDGMTGDGIHCEPVNPCHPNPCYPHVQCYRGNMTFSCDLCPLGMVGDGITCHPDPCDAGACHPGVECEPSRDGNFTCGGCPPPLVGDGISCHTPPCSSSPCHLGVDCHNLPDGNFTCGACPPGLTGDGESCSRDHCVDTPCYPGVQCYNYPDKAKCGNCPPGYIGNGVKCSVSNDPCASNPCFAGVKCVNLWMGRSKGFVCGLCPEGMVGDGVTCAETDPCSSSPCYEGVACSAVAKGSYKCGSCPANMTGDGRKCEPLHREPGPCDAHPCYPGVTCKQIGKNFKCGICPPGMKGNGINCTDIDDCRPNPCFPGVACRDEPAPGRGYQCGSCPAPYSGDGITCREPHRVPCPPSVKCFPGVNCLQAGPNVTCGQCPPEYVGDGLLCRPKCRPPCNAHQRCSQTHTCKDSTPMARSPKKLGGKCRKKCRNGGQCVGTNKCLCPPGWRGRYCHKPKCTGGCRNKGVCLGPDKCACKEGFTGPNCRQGICDPPCQNGGTCRKPGKCKCRKLFYGRTCQKNRTTRNRKSKRRKVDLIKKYLSESQVKSVLEEIKTTRPR